MKPSSYTRHASRLGHNTDVDDAIVIGGGPAGSTVAHLLAHWGHSVVVLARAPRPELDLAESLPPSCLRLLGRLGLGDAVDAAGFLRTYGNTVWWGDGDGRTESFADDGFGYQVQRSALEAVLLNAAEVSGARMYRDHTARSVALGTSPTVVCEGADGGRFELSGRFALDCSGRAGVIATQGFRTKERRHRTIALVGVWRRDGGWDLPDESHTLVETYGDGWAWSVPVSTTDRYVTVMVTPGVTDLERGARLTMAYDAELRKTRHLSTLLAGATRRSPVRSLDASLYGAERFAGPGFLLVGDAGSFIEPLSSFGVKKALASAWVAAVVVHTCLTKPEMSETALEFFDARERRVHASYQRQSARFFHEAAETHAHPFWAGRFTDADVTALEAIGDDTVDVVALREDPEVMAAFGALKVAPAIRLRPTGVLRSDRRPAIQGNEVVLEPRIVSPALPGAPDGVRYLRGVDLPALVAMAADHGQVPDLFEAYNRACPPVPLPDFLGALSVLLGKGMLENVVGTAGTVGTS